MEMAHEQHGHMDNAHSVAHHGPRTMPASLAAPEILLAWRKKMITVAIVATVVSLVFLVDRADGWGHILRAYLLGYMMTFTFAGGGLCVLMLQYVTGGKWGLLLRRPLEAMARTLPMVAVLFIPIGLLSKHLYLWARYPNEASAWAAAQHHIITEEEALTA